MSKQSLLLIGAGNIGRRHLQGILLAKNQLNIFVVEPVEVTRSLIEQAVTESGGLGQHSLQIVSSLDEIEQNDFEITIIATSADVRKKVLLDFLEKKSAKYFLGICNSDIIFDFLGVNPNFNKNSKKFLSPN